MAEMDEEPSSIVIDQGSSSIKAGIAGDDQPTVILANVIGRPRHSTSVSTAFQHEYYIGYQARAKRDFLTLQYPMEHGIVTNWDDMERIWHHIFVYELRTSSDKRPVLFTDTPLNPKGQREKMVQILFEKFNLPATYIAPQSLLSFYAMGRTLGIIVDIGDGSIQTFPVIEGYPVPSAIHRMDMGGRDLTNRLANLLLERDLCFASTAGREIVQDMKEKHAYVALDYDEELKTTERHIAERYILPDGQTIKLSYERFKCSEALFQPQMLGSSSPGIPELLHRSLMNCGVDVRRDLFGNLILSGGSSLFPGLVDRMTKEMQALVPNTMKIRFVAAPERNIAAWIGGSIICSLSTFQSQWIRKHDYEEYGPSIVHKKCV